MVLSVALLVGCGGGQGIISVNDEVITKAEYDAAFKRVTAGPQFEQMKDEIKDPESFFSLMTRDRIVNELIVKKILDQEVKKRDIVVTEEDIKAAREEMLDNIGGEERLRELLKQNNITERQFREDVKNEVKINKLVEAVSPTSVSEKDVKDFYERNKNDFNFPERVKASHILIEANPDAIAAKLMDKNKAKPLSEEQLKAQVEAEMAKQKALAEEVRAKAVATPEDFAKLAKEYSKDPGSARKGGDLGFFDKNTMVTPFSDVAFSIKPNTISDVVETQFGYHIIMVTDRAKAGIAPFSQMEPELRAFLEQSQKIENLQRLFEGLKASAKVVFIDESFNPENIQQKINAKAMQQMLQQGQQQPFAPAPMPAE
jgi:parvulin-like peptidyl-prolyl isomerase